MLTRVPDYYEAFHCLAGACPHTCCEKWEVVVDPPLSGDPRLPGGAAAGGAPDGRGGGFLLPPPGRPVPLSEPRESVRDPPDIGSRGHVPDLPDPPPVH